MSGILGLLGVLVIRLGRQTTEVVSGSPPAPSVAPLRVAEWPGLRVYVGQPDMADG